MMSLLLLLFQVLLIVTTFVPVKTVNGILANNIDDGPQIKKRQFTELSTNIEYNYIDDYGKYRLYKLKQKSGSTQVQISTVNRLLEQFLRESFDTPQKPYINVVQFCSTTMLAFVVQNATLSLSNISALLLGRVEAYDNSYYICYLSVLKQHRQNGLGTKLLNEIIKEAIQTRTSRVSLHVNSENTDALSLYLKCGMRCVDFIRGYYFGDRTYATQDAFAMTLKTENVKNSTEVCRSAAAVEIPQQEETLYKQKCPQASMG